MTTFVGFPKLDALVNAAIPPRAAAERLGIPPDRPTAIYAPTFSPHSSLQEHGVTIARELLTSGFNVIVKLHDRSLDPDPRYSGGVDWRARFAEPSDWDAWSFWLPKAKSIVYFGGLDTSTGGFTSFANSEGWIDIPPSISHERDPLIVVPITSTSARPMTDAR